MSGRGLVLLMILAVAGTLALLYSFRKRRTPPPEEAGAEENPDQGSAVIGETPGEEEPIKDELEVSGVPSPKEPGGAAAAGTVPESALPQSRASTSVGDEAVLHEMCSEEVGRSHRAESPDHGAAEETGLAVTAIPAERHEDWASRDRSGTPDVMAPSDAANWEARRGPARGPGVAVNRGGINATQTGKAAEESQAIGTAGIAGNATGPELLAHAPSVEDWGGAVPPLASDGVLDEKSADVEEEDAIPPSVDEPARQEPKTRKKKSRKYQGLRREAPQPPYANLHSGPPDAEEPTPRDRSLPLQVRLRFDRAGFCSVSLIAWRSNGLSEEITVSTPSGHLELRAMQEEWYLDVSLPDISRVLQDGTVWTQEGVGELRSWSLSGRPVYVLADRTDISGFVSQSSLVLGRNHVVLCKAEMRGEVERAIEQAGARPSRFLDESMGVPEGWIVFPGVVPTKPVTPVPGADVFNVLRPLPQIEISLEGGIRLEHADWLEGFPPTIKVYGDPAHTPEVRIDGKAAERGFEGSFQAQGWDSVGSHTIWCSGLSKSYTIVPFNSSCEPWDAYCFPVSYGSKRRSAICGPLVRSGLDESESRFGSVVVPQTNPIVLGRAPGQYALAESVSGVRGAPLLASTAFSPVWALPRDPLHCDKRTAYILLVGDVVSPDEPSGRARQRGVRRNRSVEAWCRCILDAGRKGIRTEPDTETVRALWLQYKLLARSILRGGK